MMESEAECLKKIDPPHHSVFSFIATPAIMDNECMPINGYFKHICDAGDGDDAGRHITINSTLKLSEFEISNDSTLIIKNWLVSPFFAYIFHHLNFTGEPK